MIRLSRRPLGVLAIALVVASGAMAGCKSKGRTIITESTATSTKASSPGITTTPVPKLSWAAGAAQIDKTCPYMDAMTFRTDEGDRVGQVVQLKENPVGCRFYFEYDPQVIVGEIRVKRFPTATDAYNAVAGLYKTHPEYTANTGIGDVSISVRLPLQGQNTWATLYAKGTVVVLAHSRQTDVAEDSRNIARDLVGVVK